MSNDITYDQRNFPYHASVENYILNTQADAIPDPTFHQAKRCLLDLVGVLAAGSTTELSHIINAHAVRHFGAGKGGVPLLGDGRLVSPQGAALAGGMTIDSIDAHDGMRLVKGHAGCGILPALVAVLLDRGGEFNDAEFLTALVIGYEIAIRAGIALHQSVADYHTSGAWVALGAAALTARVRQQPANIVREAMGIAEYHGPRSQMMRNIDFPTMVKDGSGWGAMAGVAAGFLAEDGFTGAPALTVIGENEAPVWRDLGQVWHIIDQYIKPWPVCRWAQPAATAALALMDEHGLKSTDISHVEVTSFHEAIRLATRIPHDTETAQYSLPWPVAAAIVRGTIGAEEVSPPFTDPHIVALAESMELVEDSAYNTAFPAERLARVTLTVTDGQSFTSKTTQATWDSDAPPDDDEMIRKFHRLADPVLGRDRAVEIAALIFDLAPRNSAANGISKLLAHITRPFQEKDV